LVFLPSVISCSTLRFGRNRFRRLCPTVQSGDGPLKSHNGDAMINDAGKHEVKNQRAITATESIRVRCFCHDGAVAMKKILACKARRP
jgi:hypothetical protein